MNNKYKYKYIKYKTKYLNLIGGVQSNKDFAQYLADFMKQSGITNENYAIIAGYCVAQITERIVTDLDVIVSNDAYNKLLDIVNTNTNKDLQHGVTSISKTEKISLNTPHGEIEFFGRETTGFPSDEFSLRNLQKNKMLDYDTFNNPYLNTDTVIKIYSDVKKINNELILGDGHKINIERLQKNIKHLNEINQILKRDDIIDKINYLNDLIKT